MAEKFGGSGSTRNVTNDFEETDKDKAESNSNNNNNNQIVQDIRKKYEKKLAAHQDDVSDADCLFKFIYILYLF